MKIFRNISTIFAILMILTFAVSMVAVPNANAQTQRTVTTYPFVDAVPRIAGVGQPVLINWGLLNYLPDVNDGFNVTLTITKPDGKVDTYKAKTWSTGTIGRKLSFMEPGNYTLQCIYEGNENITSTDWFGVTTRTTYAASESGNVTLQILEGYWKADHPGHELPAEYWTRPVDSQLREWYSIMGSWVVKPANLFAPWNDAPDSPHILWNMPVGDTMGGLSGGDNWQIGFQNGDAYEGKFVDSVIIAGVLYYNRYVSNSPRQTVVAVDLHTGKTLWEQDFDIANGRIARGQILTFISENNRGAWAYLWINEQIGDYFTGFTNNMYALDAKTGDLKYNMTNVPGDTIFVGPSGELLQYSIQTTGTTNRLLQWNSTYVVNKGTGSGTSNAWGSTIQGQTFDARTGYDINITLSGITGSVGSLITAFPTDRVIFGNTSVSGVTLTGFSLDEENRGSSLFTRRTWTAPKEWEALEIGASAFAMQSGWAAFSDDPYVAVLWTKENRVNYVFSLENGRFMYETEPQIYADAWSDTPTSMFGPEKVIAYGKLYEASVGGIVYCYDVATGELLWTYEATDKYNESYHTENWWLIITFISDHKVYLGHMVHSAQVPISRGAPFFALDAETGELVWEIDGAFRQTRWGGRALIGDSIIVTMDVYDQQIYAVGKGPSELTVASSNAVTAEGSTVLISGTVMDVSPGTQSDNLRMRFPDGVPAVSDESMSDWMLYVYKQFEQPMTVTGIEITVYAYDGNEVIDIGTTMSDSRGRYSIRWTPEKEGDYDIWAYFEGTASYYGSDAKTEIAVLETPEVVEQETPPYEWYIIGAAIVVIVVNLVVTLLLRKK